MTSNFVKLEKFDGGNFIRWQKKMKFLLTTLKVVYVLNTTRPLEKEVETLAETRERQKWDNDDYICMGHILNGMSDSLFDIYQSSISAKELWEKLESRYMQEDATSKKFLVSQFNNYKMVDSKSVMEQMHEIERILNNYKQHKMHMDETIIVSSIIDKLPPSWKDFKKSMKHKKEDISLEQLGNHLRLEEEYRKQDDTKNQFSHEKVHTIDEEDGSILYMGNASTVQVKGKGTMEIEFTSGKVLTLKDVFYVPDVRKNLISIPLLNKFGFKSVFEGDKFILSKDERKNRVLEEMVNAMLSYSGLSEGYWGEAMLTACYLLNRVPNKRKKITLYELWKKRKPNLNYIKVWGYRAIVKVHEPKRKKLGEREIESVFMGYAENSKAYRFMVVEYNDSYPINTVIESRDAIFQENRFNSIPHPKETLCSSVQSLENNVSNNDTLTCSEPRRSKRARKEKDYGLDFFMFLVKGTNDSSNSYGPI
ncbi:uncharacterized protein [Cicer arietinum]|uniref:uncharacterized protein n=1 Tax=Cicer arietinum TaxID=3827 RepID=UPI003CC631AB